MSKMTSEQKQYRFNENIMCAYPALVEPRMNNLAKKMEYSIQAIIPKGSKTHLELDALILALMLDKWGENAPIGLRLPLVDAEEKAKGKGKICPVHLVGCYTLNLRTTDKPGLVDQTGALHMNPTDCRSGDYYRLQIGGHAYTDPTPGVTFFLNNVQFAAKGEPLSGRQRAEDVFQSLDGNDGGFE